MLDGLSGARWARWTGAQRGGASYRGLGAPEARQIPNRWDNTVNNKDWILILYSQSVRDL